MTVLTGINRLWLWNVLALMLAQKDGMSIIVEQNALHLQTYNTVLCLYLNHRLQKFYSILMHADWTLFFKTYVHRVHHRHCRLYLWCTSLYVLARFKYKSQLYVNRRLCFNFFNFKTLFLIFFNLNQTITFT